MLLFRRELLLSIIKKRKIMGIPAAVVAVGGLIGGGISKMLSNDDDEDITPSQRITPQQLTKNEPVFKPANIFNMMDAISGQEFRFIRNADGEVDIRINDTSGLGDINAPIQVNRINTELPNVDNIRAVTYQEAALVSELTTRLRDISETINIIQTTAPDLIPQNQALITTFKQANQRAIDKGFNLLQNGLDKRLKKAGMYNSSTAMGTQIALLKEKVDANITNELKTAQYAMGLKEQTLNGYFELGKQITNTANTELERFRAESGNELTGRQQDIAIQGLIQQRAAEQARLALGQEELRVNTELGQRQIRANLMMQRNPNNVALPFVTDNNRTALNARDSDNNALIGATNATNQGIHNQNTAQMHQYDQRQQNSGNPMVNMAGAAAGAYLGNYGGAMGTVQALRNNGVDPNNWRNRNNG